MPERSPFLREVGKLARLALPVTGSRAGNTLLVVADVVMVGHAGPTQLAWQGVGFAVAQTIQMVGFGLLLGTLVTTAGMFARGDAPGCGEVWRRSAPYALAIGCPAAVVCLFGEDFLLAIGQTPAFAEGAGSVIMLLGLSLPFQMLFINAAFFLEGLGRPLVVTIAIFAAVGAKIGLNAVLIFGGLGLPELGAEGAAIATIVVRFGLAAALVGAILTPAMAARFATRGWPRSRWRDWRQQRRIGFADGISLGVESAAFTTLSVVSALIGTIQAAAYTIGLSVLTVIFTASLGISVATAIRTGTAGAVADPAMARNAGWGGLLLNTIIVSLIGLPALLAPHSIAGFYSPDPEVVAAAAPVIRIVAVALLADGGQRVMAQALRGMGDAWLPTASHLTAYLLVMVPLGLVSSFVIGAGAAGLALSIAVASCVSVAILALRFHRLTRRQHG